MKLLTFAFVIQFIISKVGFIHLINKYSRPEQKNV